mmetsp:Transcript_16447/g.39073  ORF Transcript_16447/g.39073 Transcript_16447/m.39073 type:complete len:211 (+) Transcript_16447:724-1356(+)
MTMVRLPSRAPLDAVVYCKPTAWSMNPRNSHTESSAPQTSTQLLMVSDAGFVASGAEPAESTGGLSSSRPTIMVAASANAAIPNRNVMQRQLSMAPAVASSVSSVLMRTWLLPKSMVTKFSKAMPLLWPSDWVAVEVACLASATPLLDAELGGSSLGAGRPTNPSEATKLAPLVSRETQQMSNAIPAAHKSRGRRPEEARANLNLRRAAA